MEYKGYRYEAEILDEEDVSKIWHDVWKDKTRVSLSFTPYEYPSFGFFKAWIDAGLPSPKDVGAIGNFRNENLGSLKEATEAYNKIHEEEEAAELQEYLDSLKQTS